MRRMSVVALAATLLAGGSTVALAQSGYGGNQAAQGMPGQTYGGSGMNQPGINRDWVPGALSPTAENQGDRMQYNRAWPAGSLSPAARNTDAQGQLGAQSRFNQRVALRRQMRQLGFRNIRILDSMFLVQARAPDGQQVIMALSPTDEASTATTSALGSSQPFSPQGQAYRSQSNQGQANRGQQFGTSRNASPTVDLRELSARMEEPGLLDAGQVRSHLQSRGFDNLSNLSRNGNIYSGSADWFGERVNVRVDARNGFVIEPSHMTQGQVRNMLGQYGWDFAGQIERQGTSYRVEATRNGRPFTLWVDARTGEINRQTASSEGSGG